MKFYALMQEHSEDLAKILVGLVVNLSSHVLIFRAGLGGRERQDID